MGFDSYLPREDGGIAFQKIGSGEDVISTRRKIFENDLKEIHASDIFLCILDGRVPDEGACVELGLAFALGKRCIGYKTDQRSFGKYGDNLMIEGCLEKTVSTKEELETFLTILKTHS